MLLNETGFLQNQVTFLQQVTAIKGLFSKAWVITLNSPVLFHTTSQDMQSHFPLPDSFSLPFCRRHMRLLTETYGCSKPLYVLSQKSLV